MSEELRFDGRVAIVTGAGGGLGRAHALQLASRGAAVVVNDLGGDIHGGGAGKSMADQVADEIKAAGGEAVANYDSVTDGDKIVQAALDTYKRLDIVINNAGILRDVSFHKMTDEDWVKIYEVHLLGSYKVSHAAWPHLRDQGYGRVIMTSSAAGIYGNFGQANYSACKLGILGLANTLAVEGANKGICVHTIAPIAGSRLTATVMPEDMLDKLKPEFVSPLVTYLCHESCTETGGLYEIGAGWYSRLRWQRTKGAGIHASKATSPEAIRDSWSAISDWEDATYPKTPQDCFGPIMENLGRPESKGGNEHIDVDKLLGYELEPVSVSYTQRDLSLYALGVGAAKDATDPKELQFVYELNADGFSALPTFGVTIPFGTLSQIMSVPGLSFNPMMLLHGEQYMELKEPLPTEGTLTTDAKISQIYDKGKGAVVIIDTTSKDDAGNEILFNQITLFIRGIGGWGGDRGPSTKINVAPDRAPDAVEEARTTDDQALLYRLSGDRNPLHADPNMAAMGGFDKPILHGLCTFGFAGRAVLKHFCDNDPSRFKSIKVRFVKHVFPGETLVTEMWKESDDRVIFRTKVKERDEVVLSNCAVELGNVKAAEKKKEAQSPNGGDSQISSIFETIKSRVAENPGLVDEIGAIYEFDITGASGGTWTVDLKNGPGSVAAEKPANADCTITISAEDFLGMASGALDPQNAFMEGKLKVGGNMMLAQKLGAIMG